MMIAISLLLVGTLALANYRVARSVLYPPFLFCMMWLLDLSLYSLNLIDINPLHTGTLALIVAGAFMFSLGSRMAFFVPGVERRIVLTRGRSLSEPRPQYKWFKYLLVVILVVVVVVQTRSLLHAAAQGVASGAAFMTRARNEQVSELGDQGLIKSVLTYLIEYVTFAAVLFLIERRDRLFWLMFAIAFLSGVIGGGRMAFLALFASLTCVYLVKTKRERFLPACRFVRVPFAVFLLMFFALMFLVKDTSGIQSSAASFAEDSLIQYIIGPTAALDDVLYHPSDYTGASNHTFKLLLSAASNAHLTDYKPPPQLDNFLFVPFPTNVYTVYKFYITDFGIPAALLIIAFIGFGHSLLYRKARTKSDLGLYMFAITMGTVITVIFDDGYSAFGVYLNALLFGILYLSMRRVPVGISLNLKWKKRRKRLNTMKRRRRLRFRLLYWVTHRPVAVAPLAPQSDEVVVTNPSDVDPSTVL